MRSRLATILVLIVGLAFLAAGCGGGRAPEVASVASSTTTSTTAAQTGSGLPAYAACMRSHGVANFPDPDSTEGIPKAEVIAAANGNPHRFNVASDACRRLLPASGSLGPQQTASQKRAQLADELSFAKCMRSHGVARFPDPTAEGQLSVEMVEAQGIDVHSSAVLHVVQTCLPASHGALTAAKVREAIANAGQ